MARPRAVIPCASFVACSLFVLGSLGCSDDAEDDAAAASSGGECDPALVRADVDVGEVTLDVVTQGCGATLIMLHGFPEFHFSWDPLVPALEKSFRLIRPNQRGYGPSDIPSDVAAYELDHLVADVAGLIDATSSDRVVLVAHDWGGPVAWAVAGRHPDKVRGLVTLNGPPPGVWAAAVQVEPQKSASSYIDFFLSPTAEESLAANDYAFLKSSFEDLVTPEQLEQYTAAWAQPGTLTGGLDWYRANLIPGPAPKPSFAAEDPPVDLPTLVLWGDDDAFLIGDVLLPAMESVAPNLDVIRFPGAGHFIMYEEPDALAEAIATFAAGL